MCTLKSLLPKELLIFLAIGLPAWIQAYGDVLAIAITGVQMRDPPDD